MTDFEEIAKFALRNKLVGRWAAEKLGKTGPDAKSYEDALAALAADNGDVFSRIRADFDAAGIAQSDADIGEAITSSTIRAGTVLDGAKSGSSDAAALALKRNLLR